MNDARSNWNGGTRGGGKITVSNTTNRPDHSDGKASRVQNQGNCRADLGNQHKGCVTSRAMNSGAMNGTDSGRGMLGSCGGRNPVVLAGNNPQLVGGNGCQSRQFDSSGKILTGKNRKAENKNCCAIKNAPAPGRRGAIKSFDGKGITGIDGIKYAGISAFGSG